MDLQRQKSAQVDINVSIFVAILAFCSEGKRLPFKCTGGRSKNHEYRGVAAYRRKFLSNIDY